MMYVCNQHQIMCTRKAGFLQLQFACLSYCLAEGNRDYLTIAYSCCYKLYSPLNASRTKWGRCQNEATVSTCKTILHALQVCRCCCLSRTEHISCNGPNWKGVYKLLLCNYCYYGSSLQVFVWGETALQNYNTPIETEVQSLDDVFCVYGNGAMYKAVRIGKTIKTE